jgi:hypothetical protein
MKQAKSTNTFLIPICKGSGRHHQMRREVRDHPTLPGRKQDRLVCEHEVCAWVQYDWGRAFKPNPKVGPNGHDGVEAPGA